MTDQERLEVLRDAFRLACKFMRDNPPGDLDLYPDIDYILACTDAANDPEGKKWQALFLRKAVLARNEKIDTIG